MVIGCLCCRRHKTVLAAGSLQAQTQSVCGMEIFMTYGIFVWKAGEKSESRERQDAL